MQYKILPKESLEIQKTLVDGDVEELFNLIGNYLINNKLVIPMGTLETLEKKTSGQKNIN